MKANLDIQGDGGVVASPSTSDPDYYYHWQRDGAISMREFMTTTTLTAVQSMVRASHTSSTGAGGQRRAQLSDGASVGAHVVLPRPRLLVQMDEYVTWVHNAQFAPDPNGIDVRGEPKFFLGSQGGAMGAVYNGVRGVWRLVRDSACTAQPACAHTLFSADCRAGCGRRTTGVRCAASHS